METHTPEFDLRAWLIVLWRRRWVIVATVAVGLLAAALFSSRSEPVYRASSQVLVQGNSVEGIVQRLGYGGALGDAGRVLANEVVLINSDETRALVADKLGYSASVRVAVTEGSDLLVFTATASDPERAASIANTYVETFIEQRRATVVDEVLQVTQLLDARVTAIDAERAQLEAEVDAARQALVVADTEIDRQAAADELDAVEARVDARTDVLDGEEASLQSSLGAVDLVDGLRDGSGVRIVSTAKPPSSPVGTSTRRTYAVAGLGSLLAGVALALLLEYLDNRIKSRSDLERSTGGLPTLAMVPRPGPDIADGDGSVVSIAHPRSVPAESYRALRTSVQFLGVQRPLHVVLVTSAASSEGKTTTVANLGVAMARVGKRVVVIDGDLRKPRLHTRFGLTARRGLTNVLLGEAELVDVAQKVPGEPNLVVVPSGPPPPNPSELLSSTRTADLIEQVADGVDAVLIASPPVLPVADSVVLAGLADGVLLVAQAGYSQRRLVSRAVEVLSHVDAPLLGSVLVNAFDEGGGSASYYYADVYGDPPEESDPTEPPSPPGPPVPAGDRSTDPPSGDGGSARPDRSGTPLTGR